MNACINCNQEVSANFCQHCGQKNDVKKLSWKTILTEMNERLLGMDNKYARTVKQLTIKPNEVITLFIKGNRVRFIGPMGYYILNLTIYLILASLLNIDLAELNTVDFSQFGMEAQTPNQEQYSSSLMKTVFDNFRIVSLLFIPFFIISYYFLFFKSKYNFIEHATLTLYSQAHPLIISIIFLFNYKFSGLNFIGYNFLISLIYSGFVCAVFYPGNKIWNFIKGILAIILAISLLMIVILILTFIWFMLNPNSLESMN